MLKIPTHLWHKLKRSNIMTIIPYLWHKHYKKSTNHIKMVIAATLQTWHKTDNTACHGCLEVWQIFNTYIIININTIN